MDGEALTLGDIRTLCFVAVGFLGTTFFAWTNRPDNFLVEDDGNNSDSDEEERSVFSSSFQS